MRVAAGLVALAAAAVGVGTLVWRAVELADRDPLLLGVRLLMPAVLAAGGHLCARHDDERGPVLLAAAALLLLESLAAGLRDLSRLAFVPPLSLATLAQSALGVSAGALALSRRGRPPGVATLLATLPSARRPLVIAPVVLLALAALYPSVAGSEVGTLQPLVAVLGPARGLPTLLAATGIVLLAPLAARTTPRAGALALGTLSVLTLGRVALQLSDVLGQRVDATVWLWLELLAAVTLLGTAARVAVDARVPGRMR